ncbi:TetR-like C-terminal domain-containing protein [Peribacillus simplex]|nr:TetR-like C-terminal domain-containing protein [Brevibacillus sp. JNUCC-41]
MIGLIIEWIDNDFKQSPAYMGDQLIQILNFHTPKFYLKDR